MKPKRIILASALLGMLGASLAAVSAFVSHPHAVSAAVVPDEPTGHLHLETGKIKGYTSNHYETMTGHDGSTEVTAYVFEAEGDTAKNPEVRFVTTGTQTVSSPYDLVAESVTNVHFWYKLINTSEKNVADVAKPYILQELASDGSYPIHEFNPIKDGEWHPWLMTIKTDYVDKFAGFIVKAGDINGSLTIANIEVNTAVVDLADSISFKSFTWSYDYIGDHFVQFSYPDNMWKETAYFDNGNASKFVDDDGHLIDLAQAIEINGHTFQYWRDLDASNSLYARNEGVHSFPTNAGGQYNPVAIEFLGNYCEFKMNLDYIPMVDNHIVFKAGAFRAYNANTGIAYELSRDLDFHSTLADSSAHFTGIQYVLGDVETDLAFSIDTVVRTDDGTPAFYEFQLWTGVPRSSYINQAWPHDNYRYMFDDILMDGKPLAWYNNWGRGNYKDWDADWNRVDDYYTYAPVNNRNYSTTVQPNIATDQTNYVFIIRVPKQLMIDLGERSIPNSFSIREGAIWYSVVDGVETRVKNTAEVTGSYISEEVDVTIESLEVGEFENGTGLLILHTDVTVGDIAYSFSDKAPFISCLEHFTLNGTSIADIAANPPAEIPLADYAIGYFDAYGYTDGVPNQSRLTVPVIVHCSGDYIRLMVHPTYWASLKTSNITVAVTSGAQTRSDNARLFTVTNNFSATTDDYFLDDLVNNMHMDYTANEGLCYTYYGIAKAKYNALTETARARFVADAEFADAYLRLQAWATINGDTVTSAGISSLGVNRFLASPTSSNMVALYAIAGLIALTTIAGVMMIRRRKHR